MNVEHLKENFNVVAVVKYEKEQWVNHNLNRYYSKLDEDGRRAALELAYDKCVAAVKEANQPKPEAKETPAKKASPKSRKPAEKNTPSAATQQVADEDGANNSTNS